MLYRAKGLLRSLVVRRVTQPSLPLAVPAQVAAHKRTSNTRLDKKRLLTPRALTTTSSASHRRPNERGILSGRSKDSRAS